MNLQPNENNEVICAFDKEYQIGEVIDGDIRAFGRIVATRIRIARVSNYNEWYNYCVSIGDDKNLYPSDSHYYAIYLD